MTIKSIQNDTPNEEQQNVDILRLKRLNVVDEYGNDVPFSSLWEKKNVVIIFLRHFGCIACSAQVDKVLNNQKEILKRKGKIVFIGNGPHVALVNFKEKMGLKNSKAQFYTDPSLKVFDACGLNRGIKNLVNTKTLKAMSNLKKEGYSQGDMIGTGTHRQMGGIIVFKNPGLVLYYFASEYLGDFDDPDQWPDHEDDLNSKAI